MALGEQGDLLQVRVRARWHWGRILLIVAVLGLGLVVGCWVVQSWSEAPLPTLTLAPEVIDLTGKRMTDREPLQVEFTLRNDSLSAIQIDRIGTNCTCTTILPEGQTEPPFTLKPGTSTSLGLTTNLASRFGPQSFWTAIESSVSGRKLALLQGRVDLVVEVPLSPFPRNLDAGKLAPGEESRKGIILGDTLNSSTVRVVALKTSDPSAIKVECRPTQEIVQQGKGYTVRGRYALDVKIKADDREPTRHELLTITLSDSQELNVPVTWSVALPFEVSPHELLIAEAQPGHRVERSVFVRRGADEDSGGALRVLKVPEGIEARVEPFGPNQWRVRIALVVPKREDLASPEVVLAAGREDRPITIPVIFRYD